MGWWVALRLLEPPQAAQHWASPGPVTLLFRIQLGAAETRIRLLEAGPVCAMEERGRIMRRLADVNAK